MASEMQRQGTEDLDEDLFNFGELYEDEGDDASEEMDVEAFLAAADDSASVQAPAASTPKGEGSVSLPSAAELEQLLRAANAAGGEERLTRTVKFGGLALLTLNALAFGAVLFGRSNDNVRLEGFQRDLELTAQELRQDVSRQVDALRGVTSPEVVLPMSLAPETFDHVRRALNAGDMPGARRQLYAALATVDRLEPADRSAFEAEAEFLLADTYRLEADAREAQTGGSQR
jgi:hypothetical protein